MIYSLMKGSQITAHKYCILQIIGRIMQWSKLKLCFKKLLRGDLTFFLDFILQFPELLVLIIPTDHKEITSDTDL